MYKRRCGCFGLSLVILLSATSVALAGQDERLVEAAKQGDADAIRLALRNKPNVNAPGADGSTALHWAVHAGGAQAVDVLIAAGANVKAANRYGVTPLALAAENGDAAILERLLKAGADANASLPGGETALMTAARTGLVDALKILLAHGARADTREQTRGQTALMWAAAEGHAGAVRTLVENGAEVHGRSRGPSWTRDPNTKTIPGFYRDYSRKGRLDSFTPLLFAVRAGHIDAANALLDAGANVNDALEDGTSALVVAIVNAHWEMASVLLDKGANPNAAEQGWTPLHQVARSRTLNIGEFPRPVATGRISSLDLAKKLIASGSDVNARMTKPMRDGYSDPFNRIGATPLLLAAKGVDHELMRLLAANGGDPRAVTTNATTVLMAVSGIGMGHLGIDSGTNEDALEAAKLALQLGVDVTVANDAGDTALHGAAARGSTALVQLLVGAGARLDLPNKKGCTPIRIANGEPSCAMLGASRPEAFVLLRQLMTERRLPIEIRSQEENVSFGVK